MSEREHALAERESAGSRPSTSRSPGSPPSGSLGGATTRRLGPYQLLEELGRGANGVVYLARRGAAEELLAVKLLLQAQDEESVLRFRREAATTARLEAPGIVRTLDFGQDGGRLYYVMEYCPGPTLKERLREGPLPPLEAAELIAALAEAMAAAHQFGVIHRDLKPSNILLEPETGRPRVTDFGLARDYIQQRLTRTGDILGTPVYMAPEQVHGKSDLDHRVDVYALGVMLYELLSGRVPFYAPELSALAKQIQSGRVTPLTELVPDLSPTLVQICARAMAPKRDDRFATASAFAAALREFTAQATPAPPTDPDPKEPARTPPWAWAALGAALLSCAALVLVLVVRPAPREARAEPTQDLRLARAEGLAQARREEVERVLLEVELQEREGAASAVLLRQLTRALAIAEGEGAVALSAKIAALELQVQSVDEARARLSDLERRNARFAPLVELEPSLKSYALAHPPNRLPADLAKRFSLLKKKVAGRSVLASFVESMSDPPSLEQLLTLLRKAAEWAPFNPPLSQEANHHALRSADALLRINQNHPTLLLLRGVIQHRLGEVEQAREAWRIVLSGFDRHQRREVVHELRELRFLTESEEDAIRNVARGG